MPDTLVSVVIPNWNGSSHLKRVLLDLSGQQLRPQEIIVVDNGSSDDSVSIATSAGAKVIALSHNSGFCHAVNRGIWAAQGDWLCVLNNDVELDPTWMRNLLAGAQTGDYWFATGKLFNAKNRSLLDGTYDALCRGACSWRCGNGKPDASSWNEMEIIDFAPLTAALFRRELFDKVGALDESFESYLEDVDLGLRCAIRGFRGVYVPDAVAYHYGSATLGRWNQETVRRISRNQILLVAKHYPKGWIRRAGWAVLVAQTLWGVLALRHGAGLAYLAGKVQGLRSFQRERKTASPEVWKVLNASESRIQRLQEKTGFDLYWRAYFWLT